MLAVCRTLYIAFFMFLPLTVMIVFIGLALHAKYHLCDPLVTGRISTGDQVPVVKIEKNSGDDVRHRWFGTGIVVDSPEFVVVSCKDCLRTA